MMGKAFLGRGWTFPVKPDLDGRLTVSEAEEKVRQSIVMLLGTARGERVMRPDYGSRLHELVFARNNTSTRNLIGNYVIEAIVTWEPRVDVLNVAVSDEPAPDGVLQVNIEYRVRSTNSLFNLVYPFYLKEGSDGVADTG